MQCGSTIASCAVPCGSGLRPPAAVDGRCTRRRFVHCADPSIAYPGDGDDQTLAVPIVAEQAPGREDDLGQLVVADVVVAPHLPDQLVVLDDALPMRDEVADALQYPARDGERSAIPLEQPGIHVQAPLVPSVLHRLLQPVTATPKPAGAGSLSVGIIWRPCMVRQGYRRIHADRARLRMRRSRPTCRRTGRWPGRGQSPKSDRFTGTTGKDKHGVRHDAHRLRRGLRPRTPSARPPAPAPRDACPDACLARPSSPAWPGRTSPWSPSGAGRHAAGRHTACSVRCATATTGWSGDVPVSAAGGNPDSQSGAPGRGGEQSRACDPGRPAVGDPWSLHAGMRHHIVMNRSSEPPRPPGPVPAFGHALRRLSRGYQSVNALVTHGPGMCSRRRRGLASAPSRACGEGLSGRQGEKVCRTSRAEIHL